MIRLFKDGNKVSRKSVTFPKTSYLNRSMSINLKKILTYYRQANVAVPSNHPLVTLINSINVPIKLDRSRFEELVEDNTPAVTSVMGIGSTIKGLSVSKKGHFYGINETLISLPPSLDSIGSKWFSLNPVKVIDHPFTDITYVAPDGTPNTAEEGLVVIGVNVVELMVMYRGWRIWQRHESLRTGLPEATLPQFIASWVLPNMISSYVDLSWRNRLIAKLTGAQTHVSKKRPPLQMLKYENVIDKVGEQIITSMSKTQSSYKDVLINTPMPFNRDCWDVTRLPMLGYTNRAQAISLIITVGWMELALLLGNINNVSDNLSYCTELDFFLKQFRKNRWIRDQHLSSLVNKRLRLTIEPHML